MTGTSCSDKYVLLQILATTPARIYLLSQKLSKVDCLQQHRDRVGLKFFMILMEWVRAAVSFYIKSKIFLTLYGIQVTVQRWI